MKKLLILALTIALALAFTVQAFAIMSGDRVFENKMGNVTFSAEKHKAAGKSCNDCHDKLFQKKKGDVAVSMPKKHLAGQGCGVCHPQVDDKTNCSFCHKK